MVVEDRECSDPWNWFIQLYSCTLAHYSVMQNLQIAWASRNTLQTDFKKGELLAVHLEKNL